ncbi:MAG: ATP-dependent Clp protease proteolytic subunit [Chitinophagales bacterium]
MPKEILLYGSIESYSSTAFIQQMEENADQDLSVRINSPGGVPEYGWGMIAKFLSHSGPKKITVDSQAHSMAAFFLCYVDDAEALDVSEFLIHRAAYPSWIENNPDYFDAAARGNLERINTSLRKAFESKVDVALFESLKGVKVKDIFSLDDRLEVFLTAAEAKKIGLINRIVKITPEKKAEINSLMKAASKANLFEVEKTGETKIVESKIIEKMTIEKLKAEHPELYAQIFGLGVASERDRVEACMVFVDLDATAVKEAISSGKPLSEKQKAEFAMKAYNKTSLKNIADDSQAKAVTTDEVKDDAKAEKPEAKAFFDDVKGQLGIEKK